MRQTLSETPYRVAALYRFCTLPLYQEMRAPLAAFCCGLGIRGTLLLAREGINGTLAGAPDAIHALIDRLQSIPAIGELEVKYSAAREMPFHRMKVRVKREIVTMGVTGVDPREATGTYVEPGDWNALISAPDTVVIDTRNDYEVRLGTFAGAVDPQTASFRDFPAWVDENRHILHGKKVAMFCTGGIRCEKATAYVRSMGLENVFHLKGGILKYLEEVPRQESLWEGECFVFDERVALTHGLEQGEAELCRACRTPLTPDDRRSAKYREGISCERCYEQRTEEDRARYAERQKQVERAARFGLPLPIGS